MRKQSLAKGKPHPHRYETIGLLIVLLFAAGVRLPGLFSQAIWYDEAITLLETAGHAEPLWPHTPTSAQMIKTQFEGAPTLGKLAEDLRRVDIHPPIYYWLLSLWRRWTGFSLEQARLFSFFCSLGAILALYFLFRAGEVERPLTLTLVYAVSTGAVYSGQEARAYALAIFFVVAGVLFAYVSWRAALQRERRSVAYALAMAVCCSAAFHTNYLTLFSISITLLWFILCLWSHSRVLAVLAPLIAVGLGSMGLPTLLQQLGARPHQYVGFVGMWEEIQTIRKLAWQVVWNPIFLSDRIGHWIYKGRGVVLGGLFVFSLAQIFRHRRGMNRQLAALLLGLAVGPAIGLALLDFYFNRRLHQFTYLIFAGPALAFLVTYGMSTLFTSQRWLGALLLGALVSLQTASVNWGSTKRLRGHPGVDMRRLARLIDTTSSPSHVVVIGRGDHGEPGHPGAVVYELKPHTMVVVLSPETNIEELLTSLQDYEDIWLVRSVDRVTVDIERRFINRLQESTRYRVMLNQAPAIRFHRDAPPSRISGEGFQL